MGIGLFLILYQHAMEIKKKLFELFTLNHRNFKIIIFDAFFFAHFLVLFFSTIFLIHLPDHRFPGRVTVCEQGRQQSWMEVGFD